jgi:hypothetical protein
LINLLLLPQYAYNAFGNSQPQVNVANIRGPHNKHQAKRIALSQLDEAALLSSDRNHFGKQVQLGANSCFSAFLQPDLSDEIGAMTVTGENGRRPGLSNISPSHQQPSARTLVGCDGD